MHNHTQTANGAEHWTMRAGFAIGAGLIAVGIVLQVSIGPVVWEALAWPCNGVALAVLLGLLLLGRAFSGHVYALRFMASYRAAIPAMTYAVVLTVIMGLTRQLEHGYWLHSMLTFWPFVLTYVCMAFILGLVALKRLGRVVRTGITWRAAVRDLTFVLNHLGLFIALVCGTLGNADMQRLKMIATTSQPEWRAMDSRQNVVELPMTIELRRFIMETYDDGSPRRFASDIHVRTEAGHSIQATVDVNHPVEVEGWKIYQYGYDTAQGPDSDYSILELVRDPWLPAVYAGIYMMLAGALLTFITPPHL